MQLNGGGKCNAIRKQNKLLRQMLKSVTDEDALADDILDQDNLFPESSRTSLSKVKLFSNHIQIS